MPAREENGVGKQHLLRSLGTSAAAACIAEVSTLPLDTVKVRLQLQNKQQLGRGPVPMYRSPVQTLTLIARREGPGALFQGLEAGLHRQFLFTGLRIGLYAPIQQAIAGRQVDTDCMPMHVKVLSALTTSAIGITIANPSDVVKVRTQAAASPSAPGTGPAAAAGSAAAARSAPGAKPPGGRRHSAPQVVCKDGQAPPRGARLIAAAPSGTAGVLSAEQLMLRRPALSTYLRIARAEGVVGGLYAGFVPNLLRNTIISACEIVVYDVAKRRWKLAGLQEGPVLHVVSGLTAGFVATVLGSPMDVVSTRIMVNRGRDPGSASMVQSIASMCRTEGVAAFYQGFLPNFLRIGSFNIVLWMSYEQLKLYFDSR